MLTSQQQAVFRPVVKKAWELHCRESHISQSNKSEYDHWYRDQLQSACQIRTTRDAGNREYRVLLTRFLLLTGETEPIAVDGFTAAQNNVLTALVTKAWETELRRSRIEPDETFSQWSSAHLEQAGIFGFAAKDRKESFDQVMAHFAVIAVDLYWIERTAAAAEIRMRFVIGKMMEDLSELTGEFVTWEYLRSIYVQMCLPLTIDEAPSTLLWKVLQAIDTHIRRLRHRHNSPSLVPF